jgi:hypothetical protein
LRLVFPALLFSDATKCTTAKIFNREISIRTMREKEILQTGRRKRERWRELAFEDEDDQVR